jgi:hypothetical protein
MPDLKQEQLDWVRAVMAHLGVPSYNALATRAGIDPSLVQKPFNPNYKGKFGADTLKRIADAAGLRPMEYPDRPAGLGEAEAVRFNYDASSDAIARNVDRAVRELTSGRNGRDAWVIQGYALELAGFLPGDIVIVDMNITPQPRDIVCAQLYDWTGGKAETVFRLYDPPFLLIHSVRFGSQKPVLVDDDRVVIRGVVDGLLRRRH